MYQNYSHNHDEANQRIVKNKGKILVQQGSAEEQHGEQQHQDIDKFICFLLHGRRSLCPSDSYKPASQYTQELACLCAPQR